MKTKLYLKRMILSLLVSGVFMQPLAGAQENPQVLSTYSNAAQANQAANETNQSLQAALDHLNTAEEQLGRSQMSGDQGQMMAAETAMNNAEDMYVGMLAKMSGVPEKEISDMHTAGLAWPEVANELGIHGMTGQMDGKGNNQRGIGDSNMTGKSDHSTMQHTSMGSKQMNSGDPGSMMRSQTSATMSDTVRDMKHGQPQGHGAGGKTGVQSNGNRGMMSGAGGLGSDMGSTDRDGHSGGMGNSGSGNHESGGHSGGGSDGGGHGGGGGM